MEKPRKRHQPKRFDVHRTLPSHTGAKHYRAPAAPQIDSLPDKIQPKKRRFGWKKILLIVFLIILIPVVAIGAWDYKNYARASEKMFGSGYLPTALPPNSLKSENGRTNLLLAGFSADDPGHSGANLTDSIMILSLDKESRTGYMLSIPRDLYVNIPGFGYAKINEVYQDGERSKFNEKGYAKGGMGLLEKVVSENFGLELHYYVLINYGAVKDTVSALDGITVTIDSKDPRGIFDPGFLPKEGGRLKLKNGAQTIDAQTALNLTRARGLAYGSYGLSQSDFDRTRNQQAVIKGIKEKTTWQLLLDPRKNPPLLDAIASNIKTDIGLNNILPLYRLFDSIPDDQLKSTALRDTTRKINLLSSYRTPSGQSALIPAEGVDDYSQIKAFVDRLDNQ